LENNTFIAYLMGKKNSGKGTYSKMLAEIIGQDKIEHFSVGDLIRDIDKELKDKKERKELIKFFEKNYRGRLSVEEVIKNLETRSTAKLLPMELIMTLIKKSIEKKEKKTLFIDGFPRDFDQINFSLFFRELIGYRDDPDIFVLIDVPEKVINERIKWRRICPLCHTSRNLKLLPTSKIGYYEKKKEFYLICDNPKCQNVKMITKEGDELGIRPIKERLKKDERLMKEALSFYGIPKILLRNSVPVKEAKELIDDYEITPEFEFRWNKAQKRVDIIKKPWKILTENNELSYSLMPPPVVLSLIHQLVKIFNL